MQCRVCGAPLAPGANACHICGSSVVPHSNPQGYGSPASPGNYGGSPLPPPTYGVPYQPEEYNQPTEQFIPGANYNQPANQPYPPYNQAGNQPYPPYNQAGNQPYQNNGYNQAGNQQYQNNGYNQGGGMSFPSAGQQVFDNGRSRAGAPFQYAGRPGSAGARRPDNLQSSRPRWGLILAILAVVLVLGVVVALVVGNVLSAPGATQTAGTNTNTSSTPTNSTGSTSNATGANSTKAASTSPTAGSAPAANTGATPSGKTIDPQASTIIVNAQTASAVDDKTYEAKAGAATTTFKIKSPIYVLFHLDTTKYDVTQQKAYINVRFYIGSQSILKDSPLAVVQNQNIGYYDAQYYQPTQAGAAEIYWCHQADCSDGKLAQVVHFTVTN
ncbi:hypothetical protein [Dictyobacter arantiisoli]|uniref:Zinc-ribbon domain-containing protein n=1 Tax=Dictyobacter arantiisoli TaxID=2014874 RepID=A0A5A5TDJ7_9CHLR|nr:hypothetical protein [Dictyobacter arantiisoli]GCF09437.1 hypothetical protein KDI_30010 [Dictyobacter arantiisoli]